MVSKIAVVALVAIVSIPILMGYALNLQTVSVTEYEEQNDPVNVTSLLQNGTSYHYVNADPYSLNTSFKMGTNIPAKVYPLYLDTSTVKSSFRIPEIIGYPDVSGPYPASRLNLSEISYFFFESFYDGTGGSLTLTVYSPDNNAIFTRTRIHTVSWQESTMTLSYTYYPNQGDNVYYSNSITVPGANYTYQFTEDTTYGSYTAGGYLYRDWDTRPYEYYLNFSKGFRVTGIPYSHNRTVLNENQMVLDIPNYTRNVLMTVELNSITSSSDEFIITVNDTYRWSYLGLIKSTDAEGEHWAAYTAHTSGNNILFDTKIADLFYDPNRSSNTYQIELNLHGGEIRYVGNWPSIIGAAPSVKTYTFNWPYNTSYEGLGMKNVAIASDSPSMRIDAAEYRSFEYPVIDNKTYDPIDFRSNPSTKITSIDRYGESITFGGNTYTIKDGNITIGTKSVPVKNMALESVPTDGALTWDNRINGTVVSTTALPSTITFNGQWSAVVMTSSMEETTYNHTEWTPGQFGWDGIDHNFLMVGLITCLGVFIGLGVYLRRSRGSVWPLFIVCGGAALLIFCML